MTLPEIPKTWLIAFLLVGLVLMRCFGIDTWTTAAISTLIGYITGKHMEQTKTSTVQQEADKIIATAKLAAATLKKKCL